MGNLSKEKMGENAETKEQVKKMNVYAVASLLVKIQNENHKIKSEFMDLKRVITKVTEDIKILRSQTNELKAIGGKGIIGGTGSTVHKKGE